MRDIKIVFLTLALLLTAIVCFPFLHHVAKQRKFSAEQWRTSDNPSQRYWMSHDLVASRYLNDKSKTDVAALLGQPSDLPLWRKSFPEYDWHYDLGSLHAPYSLSLGSDLLAIKFGTNGIVSRYAILQHHN